MYAQCGSCFSKSSQLNASASTLSTAVDRPINKSLNQFNQSSYCSLIISDEQLFSALTETDTCRNICCRGWPPSWASSSTSSFKSFAKSSPVACSSLYVPCAAIEPCEIPWDEHEQVTPHKWATYFCVYLPLQCNNHAFTAGIMILDQVPQQINQTEVHTVAQLNQLSSTSAKDWGKTGKLRWSGETKQCLFVFSIYKRSFSPKNTGYIAWQLVKNKINSKAV